jgi:hypothetical protein
MIKITKDINPYGVKIYNGAEVYPPKDITNTGVGILIVHYKDDKNQNLSIPIICDSFNKTVIQFLNEICKLNSGHNSYYEYNDFINHKLNGN